MHIERSIELTSQTHPITPRQHVIDDKMFVWHVSQHCHAISIQVMRKCESMHSFDVNCWKFSAISFYFVFMRCVTGNLSPHFGWQFKFRNVKNEIVKNFISEKKTIIYCALVRSDTIIPGTRVSLPPNLYIVLKCPKVGNNNAITVKLPHKT